MIAIRAIVFTLLAPVVVAVVLPRRIDPQAHARASVAGWFLIGAGALLYCVALLRFLLAGGTPAIFFTRHLRFLIGEEPPRLVRAGIYGFTRNPMYLGVVGAVFGQALLFDSVQIAVYGCILFVLFHLVVVFIEEPHLRRRGEYDAYMTGVPRWFGIRRQK